MSSQIEAGPHYNSLTEFYQKYKPPSDKINSKEEVQFYINKLQSFMDKVNEQVIMLQPDFRMRQNWYDQFSTPQENIKYLTSSQEAFIIYMKIEEESQMMEFDGNGMNTGTRPIILTEGFLMQQLQFNLQNQEESFKFMHYLAFINCQFFSGMKTEWKIRCSNKILEQLKQMSFEDFQIFLFYVALAKRGILLLDRQIGNNQNNAKWKPDPDICYSIVYYEAFNQDDAIVGAILPERIPCYNKDSKLDGFEYRQILYFSEFTPITKIQNRQKPYQKHIKSFRTDPDRFLCFRYSEVNLKSDAPKNQLHLHTQCKMILQGELLSQTISPLKIFKWMLKQPNHLCFKFDKDTRRWIQTELDPSQILAESKPKDSDFADQEVIAKLDQDKYTQQLSKILKMMPTLNLKLSKLQETVVQSNQNLLCLGRSGTGKTTTSVLRLFAQEILYLVLMKQRILLKHGKQQSEIAKLKLDSADLTQNTGMKVVFVTASPVLTNEVKRFYSNLKKSLQKHLQNKEKLKQQQHEEEKKEHREDEQIEVIDEQKETIEEQEKRELLEFIKKEEHQLMEDAQIDAQMALPNAYTQLQPQQFPLFVTVKRLVYMMDACLYYSFFSRDFQNNIIGLEQNLGWHNESRGVLMINQYYKESMDYDQQLAKFGKELLEMEHEADLAQEADDQFKDYGSNFIIGESQGEQRGTCGSRGNAQYILERQQLSFEVDYDVFEQRFWSKFANRKNMKKISATMVWTEIYSVIKGGQRSCYYYMGYLPKQVYVSSEASDFLTPYERKTIYYIFLEYEKWKYENNAFDFMDVVNHIQKRLWYGDRLKNMKIDFLMVDEVQDLTPKTLQLLLTLTNHNVFFSGDTAQTIAKGVSARFLDLRHIFTTLDYTVPKIVQLTKNYRSHGRILDLANSVVDLLELFFPKTIDKLQKEESDLDGLKPIVIMPLDKNSLRNLFLGTNMTQQQSQDRVPQFGCNQVLIVRDQEAKAQVPDIFKNMLCLSVYEAKGLEFDDVILYNFFHLGDVSKSQWKLLNDLVFSEVKKIKYSDELLDFNALDTEHFADYMRQLKEKEKLASDNQEYETELQLSVSKERGEIYRKFQMLCIELKFLYVAITRPKRRLIIYDDENEGRKPLLNYWERLGVVDIVTKDMLQQPETLKEGVNDLFYGGSLTRDRSTTEEWRLQGIKLFKKKYYDSAIKCFEFSQDYDLVNRCLAYQEADLGSFKLTTAESNLWRAKSIAYLTKVEKKKLLREAKRIKKESFVYFEKAGKLFKSINMNKHAASCFYTAQNYTQAAELFEDLSMYGQAAECFMKENELQKAAKLYEKANLISKAIECYESCAEWEQLLHCLHRNKDFFKPEERESLVNKYVPVALNSLYRLYSEEEGEEGLTEENKGKLQEMKIKIKYQKNVKQIVEEEEEVSSSDEEEEEEKEEEDQHNQIQEDAEEPDQQNEDDKKDQHEEDQKEEKEDQEGENKDENQENEDGEDVQEESEEEPEIDILEEVFQLKKMKSKKEEEDQNVSKEMSFEVVGQKQEESKDLNKETNTEDLQKPYINPHDLIEDFEHLSQYDPDDEFLRSSRSVSIIDSILSKKCISQTSEFSIVTSKEKSLLNVGGVNKNMIAFVETNRDIYCEDVITQKIIYYVSLFSEEVSESLKKIRSKNVLFSNPDQKNDKLSENDVLIDLDDVDSAFINLILDVLEYYELFRLCLMICNRYHMSDRLGRYVVSVCSKYSNLHLNRFNIEVMAKSQYFNMFIERQRISSILAHEAIHNVFGLINPKFLELKNFNEKMNENNSLGIESYRMMIELGFWKKLIYILPGHLSVQICQKFYDRSNLSLIYTFLQQPSTPQLQEQLSQALLKSLQKDILSQLNHKAFTIENEQALQEVKDMYREEIGQQEVGDLIVLSQFLYAVKKENAELGSTNAVKMKKMQGKNVGVEKEMYEKKIPEIIETHVFNGIKENNFKSYFFAFAFLLRQYQPNFSVFNQQLRQFFPAEHYSNLINIYLKAIKAITLDLNQSASSEIINALYSVFLVSPLDDPTCTKQEECTNCCLFKQYQTQYVLMNVNSPLLKQLLNIQENMDALMMNQFIAEKMVEIRPRYFRLRNFLQAFAKEFSDFKSNFHLKKAQMIDKYPQMFMADMDCQFLLVPKVWVQKLIIKALLTSSLQFSNDLKMVIKNRFSVGVAQAEEDNEQGESEYLMSMEEELNITGMEIQIMDKINAVVKQLRTDYSDYADKLQKQIDHQKATLNKKQDYQAIIEKHWKKVDLSLLKLGGLKFNVDQRLQYPFKLLEKQMMFRFDLGCLKEKIEIQGGNQILQQGFKCFYEAINVKYAKADEDEEVDQSRECLIRLFQAFSYFILVNKYEYMIELISQYKKSPHKQEPYTHVLSKFMIAIDIHVYLKLGAWGQAVDSIFSFINTFYKQLNELERTHLIEQGFFYALIAKNGGGFVPDYVLPMIVDINYNLDQYYQKTILPEDSEKNILMLARMNSEKDDSRLLIQVSIDTCPIEKLQSDKYYNEALYWTNKLLEEINKDFEASAKKGIYKRLYNILICACINEQKKSQKAIDELINGFTYISQSPFEDFFYQLGLSQFDFTSNKGINQVYNDFISTDDYFKHEFFASSKKHYGQYVAFINAEKAQSVENVSLVQRGMELSFGKEMKVLAGHLIVGQKIKKWMKQRKQQLLLRFKERRILQEIRQVSHSFGLTSLFLIDSLPSYQIIQHLLKLQSKTLSLKQMVVCKYATNSQDLHYILSKAEELDQIFDQFRNFVSKFIQEKGSILMEFENIDDENEINAKLKDVQSKLDQFSKDIAEWMDKKAEPNLIEVEMKNKKYKIKWESLNSIEKRQQKLQLMMKRKQEITSSMK